MTTKEDGNISIGVDVDTEKLQDAVDILDKLNSVVPDITIRDNVNVYVTINNFNATEKEHYINLED